MAAQVEKVPIGRFVPRRPVEIPRERRGSSRTCSHDNRDSPFSPKRDAWAQQSKSSVSAHLRRKIEQSRADRLGAGNKDKYTENDMKNKSDPEANMVTVGGRVRGSHDRRGSPTVAVSRAASNLRPGRPVTTTGFSRNSNLPSSKLSSRASTATGGKRVRTIWYFNYVKTH